MTSKHIENKLLDLMNEKEFIFSFSNTQGFIPMRSIQVDIDNKYQCICFFRFDDKKYFVEQKLPNKIAHLLSILVNAQFSEIEDLYSFGHEGTGSHEINLFRYKNDGKIKRINIVDEVPLNFGSTKNEKRMFELHRLLIDWLVLQNQKLESL